MLKGQKIPNRNNLGAIVFIRFCAKIINMDNYKINKAILGGSLTGIENITKISKQMNAALVGMSGIQHLIDSKINFPVSNRYNYITGLGIENIAKFDKSIKQFDKIGASFFGLSNIQSLINYQETINKSFKPIDSIITSTKFIDNYNKINKVLVPSYLKALTGIFPTIEKQTRVYNSFNKLLNLSSDSLINDAIEKDDTDRIEQVENKLEELIDITKDINAGQTLTYDHVLTINSIISKPDITGFVYFAISILVTILLHVSQLRNEKIKESKSETKQLKIENEAHHEFSKTLNILCLEERIAIRDVFIREKPTTKSTSLGVLKAGTPIFVQQINHKWTYIIYQDEDYLMRTGWVYKKYLKRIK